MCGWDRQSKTSARDGPRGVPRLLAARQPTVHETFSESRWFRLPVSRQGLRVRITRSVLVLVCRIFHIPFPCLHRSSCSMLEAATSSLPIEQQRGQARPSSAKLWAFAAASSCVSVPRRGAVGQPTRQWLGLFQSRDREQALGQDRRAGRVGAAAAESRPLRPRQSGCCADSSGKGDREVNKCVQRRDGECRDRVQRSYTNIQVHCYISSRPPSAPAAQCFIQSGP